jgi:tetratricopeptide (TPR) repeat protein
MRLARSLLLAAWAAGAAAAQALPAQDAAAPLAGGHQSSLKRLDAVLAGGDASAAAALLRQLQPEIDADERFAFDTIYVLLGRSRFAEAKEQWNRLAPRLQEALRPPASPGRGGEDERRRRAAEALYVQGLLTCRAGAKEDALRDLQQADGYGFPALDSPLILLAADCLAELQEHARAAQAYREFVERVPGDAGARLRLGVSLLASGRVAAAEKELARVLAEAAGAPQAHYWMGVLLFAQKRHELAKEHLERALALDPHCVGCMAHLAHVAYLAGDDRGCEALLAKALAADPADGETHLVAGMLANRAGRHDAAILHLERAVERAPGSSQAQYQLVLAYRRSGNAAKASEHQAVYNRLIEQQRAQSLGVRGAQ